MVKRLIFLWILMAGTCLSACAQNYVSGIVALYGDNTASGTTTIASGASLFLYKNKLYEGAGFINLGDSTAISADSGMLILNGSVAQAVTGRFKLGTLQLVNTAGANLTSAVSPTMVTILDSVSFGNISNAVLDAGDSLMTLRSNAFKTARIADLSNNGINSGNGIAGKVEVERYLRSRRAWHLLCPPTTADSINDQTIQAAWQEGARSPRGQIINPAPGYGTVITRPGNNPVTATGYDDGIAQSPYWSIHTYFSNGYFTQPPNTDLTHFSSNAAYFLFIRGDRSVTPEYQSNNYHTPSTITTLRSKGALHNGDVVKIITDESGAFAGVANPYASAVDFSKATLNNLVNGFWTWDPSIGTIGGYVYIDGDDNYNATPVTPSGVGVYTDPATNPLIQSGQAIVVKPLTSTGSITFHEQDKNPASRVDVFRLAPLPTINVSLFSGGNDPIFLDGATALFDAAFSKNALPGEDIGKPTNTNENLSFYADSLTLMKERWSMPVGGDTLALRLWQTSAAQYSFSIDAKRLPAAPQAYLLDKYLHSSSFISPENPINYHFAITADAASKASDRFAIVFKSASVLPVTISQLKAAWTGTDVQVQWNVSNETGIARYEVQRSTDGATFTTLGNEAVHGSSALSNAYLYLDETAAAGDNYYRIKMMQANGSFTYTNVAKVSVASGIMTVTVYPNPVHDRQINVLFKHAPAASYLLSLFGSDGKSITTKTVAHPGGAATYKILVQTVAQGFYHVVVTGGVDNKLKQDIPIAIE